MLAVPYLSSANDDSKPHTMSEKRSLATPISITVAVLCAAWAIYATQHRPAAGAGGPPGAGGARSSAPASVTLAPVRSERVSQKLEALGNARANESVDISTKTSNIVTAVTFRDGERVKRGQVLVQLDDAQARADVAAAQAAVTESESQYNRSRELLNTQALSKSQLRPARGHAQGESRAARRRAGASRRHRDPRAVLRTRGLAARQRRHAHQPRRRHHHAG